ncbi:MAG: PorT family protein [Salinivirgaceae bacterium]|nr:PorT family protein [Salinivirgaceae bacterium]
MKKIILMLGVVALISFNSSAQNGSSDTRKDLKIGIKGGLNLSNVYDTKSENYDANAKFGFVAGGFLAIPLGQYLGFHPELLFSQKGCRAEGTILGIDYEYTRTSNFIDVPLLIAFKPTAQLALVAGPQYSYLLKQKDEIKSGTFTDEQVTEFDNDDLRRNTLSFLGGIDINLNNLVLGARVGWDITDNNGDGTTRDPRYKNVWYQATIGFAF